MSLARLVLALPLLVASDLTDSAPAGRLLYNIGARIAGSNLRRNS